MSSTFSKTQEEQYRQAFDMFDRDHSGSIDANELFWVLQSLGLKMTFNEVQDMIEQHDKNGNGELEFEEFLVVMAENAAQGGGGGNEFMEAFQLFDKDGSGKISASELKAVLHSLGQNVTDEQVQMMMDEADVDGDGEIDYMEFVKMMTET